MKQAINIGLVGDYQESVPAHRGIPRALEMASEKLGIEIKPNWVHTTTLEFAGAATAGMDGIWCVPASPYASMNGALNSIRQARKTAQPFLGTCGGFQHALIEFARNVLGITAADHAESNPSALALVIAPLACSLVGVQGAILPQPGTRFAKITGSQAATVQYHCNYGLNRAYRGMLFTGALKVGALDEAGEVRAIELDNHPFFMATLFQPELAALNGELHPVILAFARAVAAE